MRKLSEIEARAAQLIAKRMTLASMEYDRQVDL
jgi:hypothetical protein